MSRFYEMGVIITKHDPQKAAEIKKAAESQWPFTGWWVADEDDLRASAQSTLTDGETEEEFVERVSVAIWKANGGYCDVEVNVTYLEDLPYERHHLDETDYSRLLQKQQEKRRD